jgi:hypothetical protein
VQDNSNTASHSQPSDGRDTPDRLILDHRIWWLIALAVVGTVVFFFKYNDAFSTASIDLSVPRSEIAERARSLSRELGYDKDKVIASTTFDEDENIKTFLEFEFGAKRASQLMRSEIPVWTWASRFCREHEAEECTVTLSPDKHLVKFKHSIPNDWPAPSVSHEQAEKLARDFVEQSAKRSLAGYELVGEQTQTRLKRRDYSFIWENRARDFSAARQRFSVDVVGNKVGAFTESLNLPEQWTRRYEKMRSYNTQLFNAASALYTLLLAVAVIYFFYAVATHKVRWRGAIIYSAVFAVVQTLESFNNWPLVVSQYEPVKSSYNAYLAEQAFSRFLSFAAVLVVAIVFIGAGEVIYRRFWPHRIATENWFRPSGLASKEETRGLIAGHIAPLIYLGWVVGYYIIGKNFGFFTPLFVENYQAYASSFVPAFSAVAVGVFAAVHEEIIYRVVALNLLVWLLRKIPKFPGSAAFWIANLLQAVAWGFMHSNYPQQPSYARGLELTVSGLLFGWLFQSFGLLPAIVSHYVVDSYLTARCFLTSPQPDLVATSVLSFIPFLLLLLFALYLSRSGHAPSASLVESLTNVSVTAAQEVVQEQSKEQKPESESKATLHFQTEPLHFKARAQILLAGIALFAVSLTLLHPMAIGRNAHLRVNREQAEKAGDKAMQSLGLNPAQYNRVAWLSAQNVNQDSQFQYIWEKLGAASAVRYANLSNFGFSWTVRYFHPLQPKEYRYCLDERGNEASFSITEPEDAPGMSLGEDSAVALASDYLTRHHPEFSPLEFDSVEEIRREKRKDYQVIFEAQRLRISDAPCKILVAIAGNEVSDYKQEWEIPDSWRQQFERKHFKEEVASLLVIGERVVLIGLFIWWVLGLLRSGAMTWRLPLIIGAASLALTGLNEWNASLTAFQSYSTSITVDTFFSKQVIDSAQKLLWSTLFTVISCALGVAAFRLLSQNTNIYAVLRAGFFPGDAQGKTQQRQLWLDAIICGYSMAMIRFALSHITTAVSSLVSPAVQGAALFGIAHMGNLHLPQLDIQIECFNHAVKDAVNASVISGVFAKYFGGFKKALLLVPLLVLAQHAQDRYWQDYAVNVVHSLLEWIILYVFIVRFARRNVYAYLMFGWASEIIGRLMTIALHAGSVMGGNIGFCIVLWLTPLVWLCWLFSNKIVPQDTGPASNQRLDSAT